MDQDNLSFNTFGIQRFYVNANIQLQKKVTVNINNNLN